MAAARSGFPPTTSSAYHKARFSFVFHPRPLPFLFGAHSGSAIPADTVGSGGADDKGGEAISSALRGRGGRTQAVRAQSTQREQMVQMKKVVKPSARHFAGAGVFKVYGRESLLLDAVVGRRTVEYRSLQYGRRSYPNCRMGKNLDQTILLWARI
jgi:hypothetical protein